MQFHADQIEIRHPETRALFGRIEGIDGMMKPQGWSVILEAPSLDGEQLDRCIDLLHDWFLCRPQTSSQLLAIAIPHGMTIHHGIHKTALTRIDLVFRPSDRASILHAKWRFEEQPFGEVSLHVARHHDSIESTTKLELSSPSAWIPCSMAKDRFPLFRWLGPGARFRGVVQYQESPRSWDASISGEVHDVDFGSMTGTIGSPIRGLGDASLENLQLRDGRILKASGEWRAHSGSVRLGWARRAAESLQLPAHWQPDVDDILPLEQVGLGFDLDPSGIRLIGRIRDSNGSHPIAARLGASILYADGVTIPIHRLIQGLQAREEDAAALSSVFPSPRWNPVERKESAAASWLRLSRAQDRKEP